MIQWRKSSRSQPQGGECVEVSTNLTDATLIRDSKNPDGPRLVLSNRKLAALVEQIKSGKLDL